MAVFLPPVQLLDAVVSAVCRAFGIKVHKIHQRRVHRTVMRARALCIWIFRQVTELSTPEIGDYFGIDHSTVIHHTKKIDARMATDEALRRTARSIVLAAGCEPKGLLASA